MKPSSILKIAVLAMPLMLGACKSHKKAVVEQPKVVVPDSTEQKEFLSKVGENAQSTHFITSKVKFSVEVGPQKLTLTGNLKMKRDDVIRLQLMAFGFVEAGRLEFTKDYVLIMDRINKQYLKTPYNAVDFLRNSGINFTTLQALFWNELFKPSRTTRNADGTEPDYTALLGGEDVVISLEDHKMSYSWLASDKTGIIKMANILYRDPIMGGNCQLNWDYQNFQQLDKKLYPCLHNITLTTEKKEVKLGMTLNYLGNESEWDTRTEVSNKYREVTVDEILRRFMAL